MRPLVSWNFSLVRTIDIFCILLSGVCCIFVKRLLQIFTYMENNMFVRSVPVSWRIFDNCVVMRHEIHQLVLFSKKLGHKLVFGISVYHLAPQSFSHCLNVFRCFEQFGLKLGLFWFFSRSHHYQFIMLLQLSDYTLYLWTDFVEVLCLWF